ncbi:MAG: hypothetical protein HXY41_15240 [Chloroflexi bacterium]|nr:hypothetical protein [Chloroflexota bacterium]
MTTLSLTSVLVDGLILSLGLSIVILGSLYANPRLWLHDYPTAMQQRVPPLTGAEKRARLALTALFLGMGFAALVYSGTRLLAANGGTVSFLTAFVHFFLVMNIFNLFDAVVLDLVTIALLKPRFVVLPGTEDLVYLFEDWGMHLRNYLKGIIICAAISIPAALVVAF